MATIKGFPDPTRSLAFMKLRIDLEEALVLDKSMWGDCLRLSVQNNNYPMVRLCEEIIKDYQDSPQTVVNAIGDALVNRIQKLLKP
jgi:hypothetical protein